MQRGGVREVPAITPEERAVVVGFIDRVGLAEAARVLGLSRSAITSVALGTPRSVTVLAFRSRLLELRADAKAEGTR